MATTIQIQIKQFIMSEREREITQPIYTGSLNPELRPIPRTTTGFPLAINHRLLTLKATKR